MFSIDIPAWMDRAACIGHEPDLWFPDRENQGAELAKAICKTCPVASTCLDYAITEGVIGIWGATTEGDRKAVTRKMRVA